MPKIRIENIVSIEKNKDKGGRGYVILFKDGGKIFLTKRRTIPALLILLKYGDGCEADLQKGSERLPEIKRILQGKMPENWIQDAYADANKPFSELWNEEGIVWITNTPGDRRLGSQRYVLNPEDHDKFFTLSIQKANRRSLSPIEKEDIRKKRILGVIFASHKSIHVYRLKSIHSVEIEFGRYSTTVYLSKKEGLVKRKTFKPSVFTVTNQNGKSVQFVQQKRATNALLPTQNEIK